jgi:cobalt/nickel transport system ATP-binding protein
MRTPLIETDGLRHRYDDGTAALDGVDFRLHAGESVALLGANGSGKTTFILCLTGLLHGEGEARVCGLPVEKANLAAIRRKIGVVFQDSESQLFMPTVLEDVTFGPLNLGMSPREAQDRAVTALRQVGLEGAARKAPYHLSAGEKKRAAIAGILAMQPEILALDEPTTFLDPPGQRALVQLLRELPQAKVIVTHDVAFARAVCGRAVFFDRGRIAGQGSVDEMVERFDWDPQAAAPHAAPAARP